MRSTVSRLLRNRKVFYLSFVGATAFLVLSLFLNFFTGSSSRLIGAFFILSTLFYAFSSLSYVWSNRRATAVLIRDARALQKEMASREESTIKELSAGLAKVYRTIEELEKDLDRTMTEYQESYLEQLKTQAFNSHLVVQDLKYFMSAERANDE